jgi:hypothetical protein
MNSTIEGIGCDYHRCETCCVLVPLVSSCSCEITRTNHLRAVLRARQFVAVVTPATAWAESDCQDAQAPLPSYGAGAGRRMALCIAFLLAGLIFCQGLSRLQTRGAAIVRQQQVEIETINHRSW